MNKKILESIIDDYMEDLLYVVNSIGIKATSEQKTKIGKITTKIKLLHQIKNLIS